MSNLSLGPRAPSRIGAAMPRSFDATVQSIASAAHLRGVVLTRQDKVVGSIEAAVLCKTLRAAREATRPTATGGNAEAFEHVARLAHGIAVHLGARGAVQVSQSALNLLEGYARRGRAPKKGEG